MQKWREDPSFERMIRGLHNHGVFFNELGRKIIYTFFFCLSFSRLPLSSTQLLILSSNRAIRFPSCRTWSNKASGALIRILFEMLCDASRLFHVILKISGIHHPSFPIVENHSEWFLDIPLSITGQFHWKVGFRNRPRGLSVDLSGREGYWTPYRVMQPRPCVISRSGSEVKVAEPYKR